MRHGPAWPESFALISATLNFLWIPYQPIWALIIIAADAFVIWSLLVINDDTSLEQ
ncbi:hypothetical protein Afil01_44000 [Actinorhabdospora filicis]|uniref:DUF7144 domain-containing protein n=1 Tax=Actinorhabdospora filicis TaxID=1785913 RepID=A0A9W6SNR1_9ACTN|nr:hypothetical protein Afil01_44000 [Actinorhabdospora filicis]